MVNNMNNKHLEKSSFTIQKNTNNKSSSDYLFMKENFKITDNGLMFDLNFKDKVDTLKETFQNIMYRLKYRQDSYFFTEDDLNKKYSSLLDYYLYDMDTKSKIAFQRIPINTKIKTENGYIELNNKILKINFSSFNRTVFDLPSDPDDELYKENGNVVHYVYSNNSLVFNDENEYINIRDAIIDEKLTFRNSFIININGIEKTLNNVLVYRNKFPVGTIECVSKISSTPSGMPTAIINGEEFQINYGVSYVQKKTEGISYYELLEKCIGNTTFEEYELNSTLYFLDSKKLYVVLKEGIVEVKMDNIKFSYDLPSKYKTGDVWFNMSISAILLFNGETWVQLSKPNLYTIGKMIEVDKKMDNLGEMALEIFGYDSEDEFRLVDMFIGKNIAKDVEFYLSEFFIESVYVNGDEIYDYHEANWGIHLGSPLFKNDHIQIILSKKKRFEWVNGYINNEDFLTIASPFEVEEVKLLVINDRPAFVDKIDQNRIKLENIKYIDTNEYAYITECDRVYAKVVISKNINNFYPTFVVDYKENCREIEIPFDVSVFRFDKFMITNKGKEVIINPQMIIEMDDLYVSYDPNNPKTIKFNRSLRVDDHVIIQYVNHKICDFNPEVMFGQVNSKKDLEDKLIKESMVSNFDTSVTMPMVYEELDILLNASNNIPDVPNDSEDEGEDLPIVEENPFSISLPTISKQEKSNEEKVIELINSSVFSSDPDISKNVLLNKEIPYTGSDPDTILARPSSTVVRPVVKTRVEESEKCSEYNFKFTRDYFKVRDEMKNYLLDINDKLVDTIYDITRVRDAVEAMVDYVCNILCLEEMLTAMIKLFNGILKAIYDLISMSFEEFIKKLNNLIDKIAEAIKKLIQEILDMIRNIFGAIIKEITAMLMAIINMVKQAIALVDKIFGAIGAILGKIAALFNLFDITTIGAKIGNFLSKMFEGLAKAIAKIFELIGGVIAGVLMLFVNFKDGLKMIIDKLDYFTSNIKDMTNGLTLAGIKDLICNKILGSILNIIDGVLDVLRYIQERYMDFLNKLFADRYRPRKRIWDKLKSCGSFLKSHIDLCDVLRSLISEGDLTLTGFIKKVTNITEIFDTWKYNKEVIAEYGSHKTSDDSEIDNLAGAISYLDSTIRAVDDMFGTNSQTIERINNRLKDAFVPNFKKEAESVADIQAMSDQLFDPDKFKELWKKVVTK